MSPRNFARRFTAATGETPLAYLHRLRIDAARHLLETRPRSIADVSRAVGYDDISFFRTLFKRHTGAPPRVYRSRFGPERAPPMAASRRPVSSAWCRVLIAYSRRKRVDASAPDRKTRVAKIAARVIDRSTRARQKQIARQEQRLPTARSPFSDLTESAGRDLRE